MNGADATTTMASPGIKPAREEHDEAERT